MKLDWLEDFVSIYRCGNFAKAAQERGVTQPALSRRIQALEAWAGGELFDRSQYPVSLTSAGVVFLDTATNIISKSYETRARLWPRTSFNDALVNIACLHTLSIIEVPPLVSKLHEKIGFFKTRLVSETKTIEEYILSLSEGASDLFVCYEHASFPLSIDPGEYDRIELKTDSLNLYYHDQYHQEINDPNSDQFIPFLKYSGSSFMGRLIDTVIADTPFRDRLQIVLESSLAESMKVAAMGGLGVAWLPKKLVDLDTAASTTLRQHPLYGTRLSMVAYKAKSNDRPILDRIWTELIRN